MDNAICKRERERERLMVGTGRGIKRRRDIYQVGDSEIRTAAVVFVVACDKNILVILLLF